jgi:hypothetical protein
LVQKGGPAALNGFLYQILSHLSWVASVQVSGQVSENTLSGSACIVLEPKDGGDARFESTDQYVAEQYKVRPNRTWSTRALIDDVLPDLRFAVPEPPLEKARYRFVTDGRAGRLKKFRAFLEAVKRVDTSTDLDASEQHDFGKDLPTTFLELFQHIVKVTRRNAERSRKDENYTVLHLLQRFEMAFEVSGDQHATSIEEMIRPICENIGDEGEKRQQLVGSLMERLSTGEFRLSRESVDQLLRDADLDPDRYRCLSALCETLKASLDDDLERLGYQAEQDVRETLNWPDCAPVLVVTGESGEGKTWALAKLSRAQIEAQHPVVWVSSAKDMDTALARAMRIVWQEGLGATDTKEPMALTKHYQTLAPNAPLPWLTVFVDDVRDPDVARDFINQHWSSWGMRLAMSVPTNVAYSMQQAFKGLSIHKTGSFSVQEVDEFLSRQKRRWSALPNDLQQLLRYPILAGLYAKLPQETFATAPSSEYEIFQAFWNRMEGRTQLGDSGILTSVAARVLNGGTYPISRGDWKDVGLTEVSLERLVLAGWLSVQTAGSIGFAHDRLLNWAAAVSLKEKMTSGQCTVEQFVERLLSCEEGTVGFTGNRLGYVPMDAFWLLAREDQHAVVLAEALACLEQSPHYGGHGEILYLYLLPTLGARGVALLRARLKGLAEKDFRARLVGQALAQIAKQAGVVLIDIAEQMLHSKNVNEQTVGIAIATATPSGCLLNRLWKLHQERCVVLDCSLEEREACQWDFQDYEASSEALRACVKQDPDWLRTKISAADPNKDRVTELCYLILSLDQEIGRTIWFDTKYQLVVKIPSNRPRSILNCIGRFTDHTLQEFVLSNLTKKDDIANSAAMTSLVRLAPDLAIASISENYDGSLSLSRSWWLPALLHEKPDETREALLSLAIGKQKDGIHIINELFTDYPNSIDLEILEFLLQALEAALKGPGLVTAKRGFPWITFPLRLLNRISRPKLLEKIHQVAGTRLETLIADVAIARTKDSSHVHDYNLEDCRKFLIKIGGTGITRLVDHELATDSHWGRLGGLEWAVRSGLRSSTIDLLKNIARRPVTADSDGSPSKEDILERYHSITALAAAHSDEGIVEGIWAPGPAPCAPHVAELRFENGTMNQVLTKQAKDVLLIAASSDDELEKALTIALLSEDSSFICPVRQILLNRPPDHYLARLACIALYRLNDDTSEFRERAFDLLQTKENGQSALNALLSMGGSVASNLADHLNHRSFQDWTEYEEDLALYLYRYEETREKSIEWAARLCRDGRRVYPPWEIAAELRDTDLRDRIVELAFREGNPISGQTAEAIKALAKFDSKRAIQAAERSIQSRGPVSRPILHLLGKLSPEDAASRLVMLANLREEKHYSERSVSNANGLELERAESLSAFGHALRRMEPDVVDDVLSLFINDSASAVRTIGIELAGWMPGDRLNDKIEGIFRNDVEERPRRAALDAINRKESQRTIQTLLTMLASTTEKRWSILITILDAGDPHLLSDRQDDLNLLGALDDAPFVFAWYANEALGEKVSKRK